MTRTNRRQQGLTLIELLIVMSILVVIAGLGLPSVMRMLDRSRLTSAAKELQAELNRTRLESMKSGEPLAFHYQPGTGCYEIMAKQEYDLRYPPQPLPQMPALLPNTGTTPNSSTTPDRGATPPDDTTQNSGQSRQVAGSTGPTLADRAGGSLTDLVAGQSRSLTDVAVDAPTFADLGPAPSLTDRIMSEPDMQMIAAIPVSKFMPVQKELPHQLTFQGAGSREQGAGGREQGFGVTHSDSPFLTSNSSLLTPSPSSLVPSPSLWSEPIFFFPNGRTSNAHFSVCSTDRLGLYIDVTMRGLTGTARLGDLEAVR